MELNELMEIDVKNLAKKQSEYLEAHIISKLEQAISHVKSHDFISLAIMTSYSPAGDGYVARIISLILGIQEIKKMVWTFWKFQKF